jgi:hypothetical protein
MAPVTERERPRVDVDRPRCPYCHEAVGGDDEKTGCGACMAWHHRGCWSEHGKCSACGATEAAGALHAPVARPSPELARRAVADSDRKGGLVMIAIGVVNVLFFGSLLVWGLREGPRGHDLVGLCLAIIALGVGLAAWGTWLRRGASKDSSARKG